MEIGEVVIEESYYERTCKAGIGGPGEGDVSPREREGSLPDGDSDDGRGRAHDAGEQRCREGRSEREMEFDDEYEDDEYDDEYDGDCEDGERDGEAARGKHDRGRAFDDGEWHGHNKEIGRRGENAAARYLDRIGYEILERNWTCPAGEADIIAIDEGTLVFVEVKTRKGISKGFPAEAVDAEKRARYEKIAAWYLSEYEALDVHVRFDVIALLVVGENRAFVKHYVNAFGAGC